MFLSESMKSCLEIPSVTVKTTETDGPQVNFKYPEPAAFKLSFTIENKCKNLKGCAVGNTLDSFYNITKVMPTHLKVFYVLNSCSFT